MLLQLIGLILPLCIDTFAVSAALGTAGFSDRRKVAISLFFTAFEAGMPIIGLLAGAPLRHLLGGKAEIAAYLILIGFGLYTLLHDEEDEMNAEHFKNWGVGAFLLGLTISIDEIAIGLTLGLLGMPILLVVVAIAAQAFVFSQLGFALGKKLSSKYTNEAVKLSGVILMLLGLGLLAHKLLF